MKRKIILLAYLTSVLVSQSFGQAKKPTLMIVPSDAWCKEKGFMMEFNNQGTKTYIPNYRRAFQENTDLLLVISKLNGLMADRGFPLKNMESALKSIESESAETEMLTSKTGSGVSENPIDKLRKTAKADIILQLTWKVNTSGPKKSVTFILQGLDAYTDKQIAESSGTGAPSFSSEVPVLLEEAVLAHIDKFNSSLQTHFDDMFSNGREIKLVIKKFDSWSGDLESEYGGEELSSIIENWMSKNAVKGRFNSTDVTENMMVLEQVRIPLYDANGSAIDARGFAKGLSKFLNAPPYSIVNKLMTKGLGQAVIVLGEK